MSRRATSPESWSARGEGRACRLLPTIIVLAMASSASAQEQALVSGEVTCPDCRIVLDTVVTIGGLDGPGLHLISTASHVSVDARGRILVGDRRLPEIAVFDAGGEFLRILGRAGQLTGQAFLPGSLGSRS